MNNPINKGTIVDFIQNKIQETTSDLTLLKLQVEKYDKSTDVPENLKRATVRCADKLKSYEVELERQVDTMGKETIKKYER